MALTWAGLLRAVLALAHEADLALCQVGVFQFPLSASETSAAQEMACVRW